MPKNKKDDFAIRDLIERERVAVIFDWLAKVTGKSHGQLASEMLAGAIMREAPAYREALGGGGNSSRNAELLSQKLPARR